MGRKQFAVVQGGIMACIGLLHKGLLLLYSKWNGRYKKGRRKSEIMWVVYLTALTCAISVKLIPCRDCWLQPAPGTGIDQEGLCEALQKISAGLHQKEDP